MTHRMRIVMWGGFMLGLLAGLPDTIPCQEKVTLQIQHPEGQAARYKHAYSINFYSDRAELMTASSGGSVRADLDGEWRALETVSPLQPEPWEKIEEGTIGVKIQIEEADSRGMYMGTRLTYEQFPFTMDMLNGREFWLHISPEGKPVQLAPDFKPYTLERQDLITDLRQLLQPEVYPVLPEGPVGKDDTWTGETAYEWPFAKSELMQHNAYTRLFSTYKVDKIQKKKGRIIVKIEEDRKVQYKGWVHIELVSVLVAGEGMGSAKWEIDATRGLVLSHEMTMDIDRPEVTLAGAQGPLSDIRAEFKVAFRRKLDKLVKE